MKRADLSLAVRAAMLLVLAGCNGTNTQTPDSATAVGVGKLTDWPHIASAVAIDPAIETRVTDILAGMTLRQKIGQMTQAEIKSITPEEVREYYIGSVLNGGGSWPAKNRHSSAADWLALADAYYAASTSTDAKQPVPVIWGTDAVHGHSNVVGATLFPHNIGLGAAHDPELVERIAEATAQGVRATGIQWAFAPTLAVAQNPRWGRTYESYSSDPQLVRDYAAAFVRGMQGGLGDDGNTLATAKHYVGDGATFEGRDQGEARISQGELLNIHAMGYYGALEAGVQTVMASYNSWTDTGTGIAHGKLHGATELIDTALKQKMGFDGFVVSDWNAIGQLPGCTNSSCPQAINAGIDMVMVPDDWKEFIDNTVAQVESGEIALARIDDAVTRILRVKLRAGLFEHRPSASRFAGDDAALVHRDLARRAVRESLVLLKNNGELLPLRRDARVMVVGSAADSVPDQAGGWSITWQGTDTGNADHPNADTLLAAVRSVVGDDRVSYSADAEGLVSAEFDVVIAVVGESPYAETHGDIVGSGTIAYSRRDPADLALLEAAAATGKPVVTVFLSGRPLYTNDLLNVSTAFVAAWLPGSEAKGVTDVLFAAVDGSVAYDFRGSLSMSWPGDACFGADAAPAAAVQFAPGYGLRYGQHHELGMLDVRIPEFCGTPTSIPVFNQLDIAPFALHLEHDGVLRKIGDDLNATWQWPEGEPAFEISTVQVNSQQDAKRVRWQAPGHFLARSAGGNNLSAMAQAAGAIQFDVVVHAAASGQVRFGVGCGAGCGREFDISTVLRSYLGEKMTLALPLSCLQSLGMDLGGIDVPFDVAADAPFEADFTRIAVTAGAVDGAQLLACDPVTEPGT